MRPLKIAVFLDGRPGHEKQSLGIVNALERRTDIGVQMIQVEAQGLLGTLVNLFKLKVFDCGITSQVTDADLYIGTGRQTHLPLLLSQKRYGGKAVCCMTPDFLVRGNFDLCCIPNHDNLPESDKILHTFGAPNSSTNKKRHQAGRGLILVGGIDEKSHIWKSERLLAQVEEIVETYKKIHWVISSSPRTPDETVQKIQKVAGNMDRLEFYHYTDTPRGWVEEQCDDCKFVWVSSDSVSMVYEALTAGCTVGLLPVDWKKKDSKFQRSEEFLLEGNHALSFEAWKSGGEWIDIKQDFDEAARCADFILEKWWPERCQ